MSFLWGCCDCDKKKDFLPQVKVSEKDQKEMVLIPSGEFIMGTNKVDNEDTHKKIGAVKVLGVGELSESIIVHAHKFSGSAQAKIEKSGGKVINL